MINNLPWVALPVWVILYTAMYRAVLTPAEADFAFMRLSGRSCGRSWGACSSLLFSLLLAGGLFAAGFLFGFGR